VTLLGDAAHASLPDLTQGAGQALESAVALGACLRVAADVEPALREYERRRRAEVGKVIQTARLVARWSMSEAVHVKTLRDLAARHVLPLIGYPTISRLAGVGA
jgi:2-polyprenyl-6-methoxyphenol hydroxylase-like FAD-dependent oxidoreductase